MCSEICVSTSLVPSPSHPSFYLAAFDKSWGGKDWERGYVSTLRNEVTIHLIGVPPLWMILRYLSVGVKKDKNLFIWGGGR